MTLALKHSLAISRQQDCGAVCSWNVQRYLRFSGSWYNFGTINLSYLPVVRPQILTGTLLFVVRHASRARKVFFDIVA